MEIYKPNVIQFETQIQLYQHSEDLIVTQILSLVGDIGLVRMSFAGGSTPLKLYKKLGENVLIPWENIEIYQVDERYLDKLNDHSNQFQIQSALTQEILSTCKDVNFFNTSYPIDLAAKEYSQILDSLDGTLFDITILGIGPDGHIASLFPNSDHLKHQDVRAIVTEAPEEYHDTERLSLTLESILSSDLILVMLVGDDKKDVVQEILQGDLSASEFPAKFLLAHPNVYIYQTLEENENK